MTIDDLTPESVEPEAWQRPRRLEGSWTQPPPIEQPLGGAVPGFVMPLKLDDAPTFSWQMKCRYCGAQYGSSQGRAGHERICDHRPAEPPVPDGSVEVVVEHPPSDDRRFSWSASRDGEVIADGLGRTWATALDAGENARSYLAGAWDAPTASSRRHTAQQREKREKKKKGSASPRPRRGGGSRGGEVEHLAPLSTQQLLEGLDRLSGGVTFPASALSDVAEWLELTQRLISKGRAR